MMKLTASLTLAFSLLAGAASAAQNGAPAFAASTEVHGTRLQLNGAGTRYKTIFKIYDLALYTTRKVGTPEEAVALPGPKKLQFVALRELSTTDLGRLFVKGMSDNASREQNIRQMVASTRLVEIFSSRNKVLAGETFALEYTPGKGTQFIHQGQNVGEPLGDAEFFAMVMGIWFGSSPADRLLENALLGREAQAAQNAH